MPGPGVEVRFKDGTAPRVKPDLDRSGCPLYDGIGGRESSFVPVSSGLGMSDREGNVGINVEFKYSLPSGLSRAWTCHVPISPFTVSAS